MQLGDMYASMSFVGSIGTSIADTGLTDALSAVFGGLAKMLTGKQLHLNVRAMCLAAEEFLRNCLQTTPAACKTNPVTELEAMASKSNTTKAVDRCTRQASVHHGDVHQSGDGRRLVIPP